MSSVEHFGQTPSAWAVHATGHDRRRFAAVRYYPAVSAAAKRSCAARREWLRRDGSISAQRVTFGTALAARAAIAAAEARS